MRLTENTNFKETYPKIATEFNANLTEKMALLEYLIPKPSSVHLKGINLSQIRGHVRLTISQNYIWKNCDYFYSFR